MNISDRRSGTIQTLAWYLLTISLLTVATFSKAAEIVERTILNSASIDSLLDETLDGKPLRTLITPVQERMIRDYGFEMTLIHRQEVFFDESLIELTERYADEVKLTENNRIEGYVAGMPFKEINIDDPRAAVKLAYNFLRAPWMGQNVDYDPMYFLIIDGKKGLQRQQGWRFQRYMLEGQKQNPHKEDSQLSKYQSLFAQYPQDIRGLGVLTVNYQNNRLPDVYAYVKQLRRVRRLSSGAWADPVASSDFLTDELFGLDSQPNWYEKWELLEKRWMLTTVHGESFGLDEYEDNPELRYPKIKLNQPPHWNFEEVYEPREVWVVKTTMNEKHTYATRHYYFDAHLYTPMLPWQEAYNEKGELEKVMVIGYQSVPWEDGVSGVGAGIVSAIDIKKMHATVLYNAPLDQYRINNPYAVAKEFAPQSLSRRFK
ncbi:MAG: hypothetical protein DRQ60_09935 [Gammaproteobacteria bacterium]|nr:MAG: hypothetical protein DRQ54_00595 [Gammaproteobacteria bacterium]RLA11418.1 MAG: hypothetical protein DRQ60_09935 [Gammaproteobacteria bacterium]RLA16134.1 MAG: hypothetical protein DRQ52_00100 [Gammaproteobacteria bacterium]